MPDANGFDAGRARAPGPPAPPVTWTGAFAALPLQAPPAGGWERLRERLPRTTPARRRRWPAWGALAASLALAVAIPLQLRPDTAPPAAPVAPVAEASGNAIGAGDDAQAASRTPITAVASATPAAPARVPDAAAGSRAAAGTASTSRPIRKPRPAAPAQEPIRTLAPAPGTALLASADLEAIRALQDESAQLEGILALARDDRVSSGTAAALSSGLDDRLADIDAALLQPGLEPARRSALWSERVDALRQLVGIETTQRLYAARGQSFDAALVSID